MIDALDSAQREAVEAEELRLLISAGPGSGKTRVLVARLKRLLNQGQSALCLSFTNKAASVMKERAGCVRPKGALFIGTFHSFCLDVLYKERPELRLISRARQKRLLKEAAIEDPRGALKEISSYKSNLYSQTTRTKEPSIESLVATYDKLLSASDLMDLDDLILLTIKLFDQDPEILARYQRMYSNVMVDEFQDINPPQARLVKLLVAGSGVSLFAIGDMDQAIYGFRGANLSGFADFTRVSPEARVIRLDTNYRSRKSIVDASRLLIEAGTDSAHRGLKRGLKSVTPGGDISLVECADERGEGAFIVKEIAGLMGALSSLSEAREGTGDLGFSDFAVLYRTNRQAKALEESFKSANIPYQVLGAVVEEELEEISEALEDVEFKVDGPLGPIVEQEAKRAGLSTQMAARLIDMAEGLMCTESGRRKFLDRIMLLSPRDFCGIVVDRVTLATLHMSKGLEFKVVFIAGAEDGLIPLFRKDGVDIEEERRLFYVAVTRAIDSLYLLSAGERQVYGERVRPKRSPFLSAIPEELTKTMTIKKKRRVRRPLQKGLFD